MTPGAKSFTALLAPEQGLAPGATNCDSICQPALMASSIKVAPSITNAFSCARSDLSLHNLRKR
jgi:hypothetical protein